jgi:MoaA/NifB/PqqE/SkfB family radical SAM enzyme
MVLSPLRYPVTYLKKGLFQTIFNVTWRCNGRCDFCFNREKLNTRQNEELDTLEIEAIARSMPPFPWLMISGGEPGLREDLADIVMMFNRINRVRHVTLPTNGLLPKRMEGICRDILARAGGMTLTLAVSIDNIGAKHDQLRQTPGNFAKALKTVEAAGELKSRFPNFGVKVNTVVSTANHEDVGEIIRFVKGLDVDMHTLDIVRALPEGSDRFLPVERVGEIMESMQQIHDHYQGYRHLGRHARPLTGFSRALLKRTGELTVEVIRRERQVIPCYAGRVNAVLYPTGDVAPCEMLPAMGNLREVGYDFKSIWHSEEAGRVRQSIRRGECWCYHPCYLVTNILFNPGEVLKSIARMR